MRINELYPVLAVCLLGTITGVTGAVLPDGRPGFSLARRQDEIEGGEVEAQDTTKLRECKPPKDVYIEQDNVEWNEVNKDKTKLEVTITTKKGEKNIPAPKDANQGSTFNTDHIFELQIVTDAFEDKNRKYNDDAEKIKDDAWKTAHDAVNGDNRDNCKLVAGNVTTLDNLLGIADKINQAKKVVYQRVLTDNTDKDLKKYTDYLKAISAYLEDSKTGVDTTIDKTGGSLRYITGSEDVEKYFTTFCKDKYKAGQKYVQDQLDNEDGGEETKQCLPLGTDCVSDPNNCCSQMCAMDKGQGTMTCQGRDP